MNSKSEGRTYQGHRQQCNIEIHVYCYYMSLIGSDVACQIGAIMMTLNILGNLSMSMGFFVSVCTTCQDFDWHNTLRNPSANSRACLRACVNCETIYSVIWCCSVMHCCYVLCIAKNIRSNTRSCDELLKSTPSNTTRRCKSLSALKENISGVIEVLF